jgi:23S rRNA (guanosine2251-2'-O)-methyltransferase
MEKIITGFHAIEERITRIKEQNSRSTGVRIVYSKPGPRVKKILMLAKEVGISCVPTDDDMLGKLVQLLPETSRDHRGIVLCVSGDETGLQNVVEFDSWVAAHNDSGKESCTVVILDSVTDPHNVGAIIRSCDQFGTSLIVLPEMRGVNDIAGNDVIARASAGASTWVPVAVVTNLVRAVEQLKKAGFWVYGADAGGMRVDQIDFAEKTVIIMGSEGTGISRLLSEKCDAVVSIPTCGKIDSLNVSVAAGILLFERYRRTLSACDKV